MPKPCEILGITGPNAIWKLQYGLPGVSGIKEVSAAGLSDGFEQIPYFAATQDGWVQVRVQVNAGTTSGSTYPRCELRQMKPGGGKEAAWDSKTLDCWFEYELAVTHLPPAKPQMCVLQLHDDEDDLLEVIYQRNSSGGYEITQRIDGSSSGQPKIPHDLNKPFVLALGLVKGVVTIYRDGNPILSTSRMPQSTVTYAKLLNYLQSNTKYDKVPEYGELRARNVRTGVGAYPGPQPVPTPEPSPAPDATVIVVRHGEKPPDSGPPYGITAAGERDEHSLTTRGWARAGALVNLFNGYSRAMPKPTAIYASKGSTASMRPLQTVQFVAHNLGLAPITRYDLEVEPEFAAMVAEVKARPGVTLVSAEHKQIDDFVQALTGITTTPEWPSDRFDVCWVLTRKDGVWSTRRIPQNLLPGDRTTTF